jgi:hypothetical protein
MVFLLKKRFLSDGVRQSGVLIEEVKREPMDRVLIDKILHQWIGTGASAGFLEISERAGRMRYLISCKIPDLAALNEEAQALGKLFQKISLNTYVSFIGFLRLGFYTENSFALLDARVS